MKLLYSLLVCACTLSAQVTTYPSGSSASTAQQASSIATDTRALRSAVCEGVVTSSCSTLPAGGTITLMSYSGGPGNIEQFQIAEAAVTEHTATDSTIKVTVDGQQVLSADMGTFMLWHGGPVPFQSKNIALTHITDSGFSTASGSWGGYRKLNIHWYTSISVTLTNADGSNTASMYSQVLYRLGAPTDPTKARTFHSYAAFCCTAVNAFASYNILPTQLTTAGHTGYLDSVTLFGYVSGSNTVMTPLEGNVSVTVDGGAANAANGGYVLNYGGTEDFFLDQFYADQLQVYQDEGGGGAYNDSVAAITCWHAYRYFHEFPVTFKQSVTISDFNGQVNEPSNGISPPTWNFAALVIYYTD